MAIEKDIEIHKTRGVKNCLEYVDDKEKCSMEEEISLDVESVLDYSQNTNKTTADDEVILTSGVNCNPRYAAEQFEKTARAYRRIKPEGTGLGSGGTKLIKDRKTGEMKRVAKESIEAHHVIQSFPAVDGLDPKLVHEIGKEYAAAAFPGHQCVVSTHMNTGHLHNHIVVCAYKMDCSGKFLMNNKARYRLRNINDELSLKYNLPILVGNEHRFDHIQGIGEQYAQKAGVAFKEDIRNRIEQALSKDFVTSWADFTLYMKTFGIEMKETPKNVTYIMKYKDSAGNEKTHRCRDSRLGDKYMRVSICKTRGWEYPNEMQQTNYSRFLKNAYNYNTSKNDDLFIKKGRLHLHVDRYDENGRRRSLFEITIIAAIKIIQHFWEKHFKKAAYPKHTANKEAVNWDPDKKIATLLEALEIARTFNIDSPEQLKDRMSSNGKQAAVLGKELTVTEMAYTKVMEEYEKFQKAGMDPQSKSEYAKKLHDLSGRYAVMKNTLSRLKQEYALLSRLSRAVTLAKDPVFVLGATTSLSEYPKKTILEHNNVNDQETKPQAKHEATHKNTAPSLSS